MRAPGRMLMESSSLAAYQVRHVPYQRWSLPKRTFVFICVVATFCRSWWSHLDANALLYWRSWVGSGVRFRAREGQLCTEPWSLYLLMCFNVSRNHTERPRLMSTRHGYNGPLRGSNPAREHLETKRNFMFSVFMVFLSTPPDFTAADRLLELIDDF